MGGSSAPMAYTPGNQAGADSSYTSNLNSLTQGNQQTYGTAQTGFNQTYQNVLNNPYAGQAQSGANAAGAAQYGAGQADMNNASTMNGMAPSIMASGFDPTSAMYNHQMKSAQDASQIAQAQAGVAGSPFGAGQVGDATTNFNLDWQAGQAQKQQQAIAALSQLFSGSSGLAATGASQMMQGAAAPAQASNANQTSIMTALAQLVNGTNAAGSAVNKDVSQYGDYLNIGQGATNSQVQATQANNAAPGWLSALGSLGGMGAQLAMAGGASGSGTGGFNPTAAFQNIGGMQYQDMGGQAALPNVSFAGS